MKLFETNLDGLKQFSLHGIQPGVGHSIQEDIGLLPLPNCDIRFVVQAVENARDLAVPDVVQQASLLLLFQQALENRGDFVWEGEEMVKVPHLFRAIRLLNVHRVRSLRTCE